MYWEILNFLSLDKIKVLEREVYDRMFYCVLPFCVWNRLWSCSRSQFDPNICQFCAKLQIKDKKVIKEIIKKLKLDARIFFFQCNYIIVPFPTVWVPCLFMLILVLADKDHILKTTMVFCIMKQLILHLWFLRLT